MSLQNILIREFVNIWGLNFPKQNASGHCLQLTEIGALSLGLGTNFSRSCLLSQDPRFRMSPEKHRCTDSITSNLLSILLQWYLENKGGKKSKKPQTLYSVCILYISIYIYIHTCTCINVYIYILTCFKEDNRIAFHITFSLLSSRKVAWAFIEDNLTLTLSCQLLLH